MHPRFTEFSADSYGVAVLDTRGRWHLIAAYDYNEEGLADARSDAVYYRGRINSRDGFVALRIGHVAAVSVCPCIGGAVCGKIAPEWLAQKKAA